MTTLIDPETRPIPVPARTNFHNIPFDAIVGHAAVLALPALPASTRRKLMAELSRARDYAADHKSASLRRSTRRITWIILRACPNDRLRAAGMREMRRQQYPAFRRRTDFLGIERQLHEGGQAVANGAWGRAAISLSLLALLSFRASNHSA